jgi:hypothetical protein
MVNHTYSTNSVSLDFDLNFMSVTLNTDSLKSRAIDLEIYTENFFTLDQYMAKI